MTVAEQARRLIDAGISVIPIKADGSKAPAVTTWKQYQVRIADESNLRNWFRGRRPSTTQNDGCLPAEGRQAFTIGLAAVCGAVSGNLECIDFDDGRAYENWQAVVGWDEEGEALLSSLVITETPGPGVQVWYRCEAPVPGNAKLAREPKAGGGWEVLIETRGEGGYALIPPTPPECHPNRRPYRMLQGDFAAPGLLTTGQRSVLQEAARALNRYVEPSLEPKRLKTAFRATDDDLSPGEDYNGRGDWGELLAKHGWTLKRRLGEAEHWLRPGGDPHKVCSATVGHVAPGILYVFSTNAAPFASEKSYDLFGAYAWLEHGGDFAAAGRALREQGFGSAPKRAGNGPKPPSRSPAPAAGTAATEEPQRWREEGPPPDDGDDPEGSKEKDNCAESAARWAVARRNTFLWSEGKNWDEWRPCRYWVPIGDEVLRSDIYHWLVQTKGTVSKERINAMTFLGAALLGSGNRPFDRDGFNPRRDCIPVLNGMLDARTRALSPHVPENYNTYCLDFEYDPAAACPRFDQFLADSMRREDGSVCEEWVEVVTAWMGYCLIPSAAAECVLINVGEGGNGKSVWLKVLEGLVGSAACMSIDPKSFSDKPEYYLAALFGKLVGFINEPNPKSLRDASGTLKAISSGDPVSARQPSKPVFTYRPYCRLVINCNSMPETNDLSHGFFRRLLLVEWRNRPAQPDPALATKLLAERPGILNRALDALDRLRERGYLFDEPEESRKLKADYRRSQDVVQQWFEECCEADFGGFETTDALFRSFVAWCKASECRPMSKDGFGKRLSRMGYPSAVKEVEAASCRVRNGLALLTGSLRVLTGCDYDLSGIS